MKYLVFCRVINFLVPWFICLSSSFVHCKNGPEYLTRRTAHMSFLSQSFVSRIFSRSSEVIFSYFFFYLWWHIIFLFFKRFNAFLTWKFYSFRFFFCFSFSQFSLSAWYIFQWKIPFMYSGILLFVSVSPVLFRFLQKAWYNPST